MEQPVTGEPQLSRLHDLDRAACLERLAYGSYVGRLGFMAEERLMIAPVNYIVDGEDVVIRSSHNSRLAALAGSAVVFEVDSSHPLDHAGWSVVIHGTLEIVEDPELIERLRRGPLRSWAWVGGDVWLRLPIADISGRRVGPG